MPPKFARIPDSSDRRGARDLERQSLLDAGDSGDDDFFLNGPRVDTQRLHHDPKMNRLRGQVDDVVDIMKTNVDKVVQRGDRLEDLQDKSGKCICKYGDSLANNSDMFRSRAKSLHNTMWWKNCKMKLIIAIVILVILTIIVVIIVTQVQK